MKNHREELIRKFRSILDNEQSTENEIQKFLEENTELIPLPFLLNHWLHLNVVISKLEISSSFKTDFAYLTKSSDMWNLVLIEIEDSKKNIFLKNNENIKFSSEFNNAFDQVMEWKAYINDNKQEVLKKIEVLKKPLSRNMVKVKYVLIIGRNKEKDNSERKRRMFAEKSNEEIRVMTYDSLISHYIKSTSDLRKLILAPWREGFRIKQIPNNIETDIFAYVKPEYLDLTKDNIEEFKKQDYQIDKWLQGTMLNAGGKYDDESFAERTNNKLIKAVLMNKY